jgi:hypothetical protein
VTPSSVSLAASAPTPITVSVTTTARSLAPPIAYPRPRGLIGSTLWLLGWLTVLLALAWRRTVLVPPRRTRLWVPLGAALLFITLWTACGGGGGTPGPPPMMGTPAGTYTLAVAATGSG